MNVDDDFLDANAFLKTPPSAPTIPNQQAIFNPMTVSVQQQHHQQQPHHFTNMQQQPMFFNPMMQQTPFHMMHQQQNFLAQQQQQAFQFSKPSPMVMVKQEQQQPFDASPQFSPTPLISLTSPKDTSLPAAATPSPFMATPSPTYSNLFEQISAAPQQPLPMSNVFPQQHNVQNIIKHVEGFNKPIQKKQPGGRDNTKHCLPRQVMEINPSVVPTETIQQMYMKAYVLGTDKVSRNKIILGDLGEAKFVETANPSGKRWLALFNNLIVKFSSHLNGQKLGLRFILFNGKNQICYIDSEEFETITKRGKEKQVERQKRKRTDYDTASTVEDCDPPVGVTLGGDLVKVNGRGFVCPPLSQVVVKFGEKNAKEIHCIKRNTIICETPDNEAGFVDVNVSLDKKAFLQTNARYQYIDPNNLQDLQAVANYIQQRKSAQQFSMPASTPSPAPSPAPDSDSVVFSPMQNAWIEGKEVDSCGFTVLHHACAHGFTELTYFLIDSACDLHRRDNYGRTAIFWALWSGSSSIASMLINAGAQFDIQDEVGENPLHIAVEKNQSFATKQLLFELLRCDNEERLNAQIIAKMIDQKNSAGDTPLELAEDDDETTEFASILKAVRNICLKRVQEMNMTVTELRFKSGVHNTKTLAQVDAAATCKLQIWSKSLVLQVTSQGKTYRSVLDHSSFMFLILNKQQSRVEVTLTQVPTVLEQDDESWQPVANHWAACQQFDMTISEKDLALVQFHMSKTATMSELQPGTFRYAIVASNPNSTVQKDEKQSKKPTSKMSLLRQQMDKLRLKQAPLVKPTNPTSTTTTSPTIHEAMVHTLQQIQ